MQRCADVEMRRCKDAKMHRCRDAEMHGCEAARMRGCSDVRMRYNFNPYMCIWLMGKEQGGARMHWFGCMLHRMFVCVYCVDLNCNLTFWIHSHWPIRSDATRTLTFSKIMECIFFPTLLFCSWREVPRSLMSSLWTDKCPLMVMKHRSESQTRWAYSHWVNIKSATNQKDRMKRRGVSIEIIGELRNLNRID